MKKKKVKLIRRKRGDWLIIIQEKDGDMKYKMNQENYFIT